MGKKLKAQEEQPAQDAQPVDIEKLMLLPLSEVLKLPEEQQALIMRESQLRASPEDWQMLNKTLKDIDKLVNAIPKVDPEIINKVLGRSWDEHIAATKKMIVNLLNGIDFDIFLKRMENFEEVYPLLEPYIRKISEERPDKGRGLPMTEGFAEAARMARADGVEVPRLWFEEEEEAQGEQLQMDLDLPEGEANKKETLDAAAMLETLQAIQALTPAAHVMPNNTLINFMQSHGTINAGAFDLPVANETARRKEITNYTMISYDPGDSGIKITDPHLPEYERQVSDAIMSIWAEAERINTDPAFTEEMVYRNMPGGGERASEKQLAAIVRTLEKFRRLHIFMDATDEMRKRGKIDKDQTWVYDEYYLQLKRCEITCKHSKKKRYGYYITSEPIMLTYSKMTGQLLTVNSKHLTIKKVKGGLISPELVNMTQDRQAMVGYMLRRIAIIKHDAETAKEALRQYEKRRKAEGLEKKTWEAFRKQSPVILFDTLFENTGTVTNDRKQAGLNRAFCYDVLDYWKATGFIGGYQEQTKGRKIAGFSVVV